MSVFLTTIFAAFALSSIFDAISQRRSAWRVLIASLITFILLAFAVHGYFTTEYASESDLPELLGALIFGAMAYALWAGVSAWECILDDVDASELSGGVEGWSVIVALTTFVASLIALGISNAFE